MKVAVAYRLPIGPIQASLAIAAKAKGFDVLEMAKSNPQVPLKGDWDDYDVIVYFHNGPPTFKTRAKVLWWMCDLRDPATLHTNHTTADEMFVCNHVYKGAYAAHFGKPSFYLPQCGIDTEMTVGRKIGWDVAFLGVVRAGKPFDYSNDPANVPGLVTTRDFHGNRHAVINALRERHKVEVISREGLTKDQKWIYNRSPISLSISLPAKGYTSNRLYNILSSGGFALVNWFPGIEYLFENGKHLVWFKTLKEAKELAEFYTGSPRERDKIAEYGRKLYEGRDTAAHRLGYILGDTK